MSVESLIRDRLNAKKTASVVTESTETETPVLDEAYPGMGKGKEEEPPLQGSSKRVNPEVLEKGSGGGKTMRKSNAPLAAGSGPMDKKNPLQGDSEPNPKEEDLGKDEPGKIAASKISKTTKLPKGNGAGKAPNFSTTVDPASVVNQASSKGNVMQHGEEAEKEGEVVAEQNFDVSKLFASETELSDEFKTKAASMFEAVVTARVAEQVAVIKDQLADEAATMVAEAEEAMVEKIDAYLTEIVDQWLTENEVPVVASLRSEVAEDFMEGLKELFKEHYIEVPEEKYDLLGELQASVESQKEENEKLAEEINQITEAYLALKKEAVIADITEGLADTQVEKFRTVIEDVTFEDAESYAEKLTVIKENIFSTEKKEEVIEEEVTGDIKEKSPAMAKYVDVLSRGSSF